MNAQPITPESSPASAKEAGVFSVGAAALRLVPTLVLAPLGLAAYNFTPVGGFATFAGARVRTWLAYALPLAIMIATDLILWPIKGENYAPWHFSQPVVYVCYLGYVLLARVLAKYGRLGIVSAAILGSFQFYLITNFASWVELSAAPLNLYARTLDGLLSCYVAALTFYQNTFISDLLFPLVFLGLHDAWQRYVEPAAQPVEAPHS